MAVRASQMIQGQVAIDVNNGSQYWTDNETVLGVNLLLGVVIVMISSEEEHATTTIGPSLSSNLLVYLKLAEFLLKMILGKNAQNVQKITDLIKENPRTTLLELEQDTGISKTTIGRIVTKDLKLKKTPAKFIPRFLTNEQKLCRLATCENMLEMTRTDPEWKDKIITGDKTWVYDYDPETKPQYAEWRGQDIAPNDFFLFPKLKAVLKGRHFDTRDDIIEKSLLALKSIPKELYKNCFDNLGKRWRWSGRAIVHSRTIFVPLISWSIKAEHS
ncbi:hypothetical protein LAZ67_X003281 [Cordylochernes scorpioides]|uniref:Transposase n=1 Tax=Cordylochernes scorpioides TaxID=51811 RepID=A0ABY6LV33_9ARAC|nr:hypothetical protein LAZ67_X003281 [Cordylochernes scorpioides]